MDQKRPSAAHVIKNRKISASSSDYDPDQKIDRSHGSETKEQRQTRLEYAENPLFARFWYTANVAQTWLRNHRDYVDQSMKSPIPPRDWIPPPPPPPPLLPALLSRAVVRRSSKKSRKRKIIDLETGASPKMMEVSEEWEGVVSISSEMPAENVEESGEKMDLSEDVIAFMTQTIRHRIEREKKKAYEQEVQDKTVVFVPADRPFMASRFNEFGGNASAVADMLLHRGGNDSKLTAAEQKRHEMIRLYGTEAAGRIQAQETLMQMMFDHEYDKDHPPFWPNIPLKL